MKTRILSLMVAVIALLCFALTAYAEQMISTTLVMRVSRMTQSAVVNAGEDLSMEVNIDGAEPASYQWYFEDAPIEGANQKVYSVINAQPEHSGLYRLDAFDESGKLVVSMDITARVVDAEVPKSGDTTLPVSLVLSAMGLAAGVLFITKRRQAA
ncbi:MAG: hypothetical protein IJ234_06430 [Clostridia bacterium]|nr:hypothetical protein [Clostridia bacterium]